MLKMTGKNIFQGLFAFYIISSLLGGWSDKSSLARPSETITSESDPKNLQRLRNNNCVLQFIGHN